MHFCYRRTIRLKQENFSCNNKTNYTRRHKFITHKNNCCQVFSRSRNDQPMFVNECKFKEGWQSSSLKTRFLDFAEQNINIFSANPNHTPRLLTNIYISNNFQPHFGNKCKFTTLLCAPPQIFVVAERIRSDVAIGLCPTRSMLLLQLIPVSLRQIPKTSQKVTNLRGESLTVPRA